MCAILGYSGKVEASWLRQLFRRAAAYGPHAVGLAYLDAPSHVKVFKRAIHPDYFLRNCNHRLERAARFQLGLGHTRYGTVGDVKSDDNAHPFTDHGLIYAHNGCISNYRQLRHDAVVDSQCLGPLIKRRCPGLADGSIGLIWLENSQLYVYRRHQGLCAFKIHYHDGDSTVLIASRRGIVTTCPLMLDIDFAEELPIHEGIAYRVDHDKLVAVWTDNKTYEFNDTEISRGQFTHHEAGFQGAGMNYHGG
jgi:glutamine phosphoribosylpyrophosphate amidotransferase